MIVITDICCYKRCLCFIFQNFVRVSQESMAVNSDPICNAMEYGAVSSDYPNSPFSWSRCAVICSSSFCNKIIHCKSAYMSFYHVYCIPLMSGFLNQCYLQCAPCWCHFPIIIDPWNLGLCTLRACFLFKGFACFS